MRLAHVVDYFQPQLGYQECYLAQEQQALGHQAMVFTSDRYHPMVRQAGLRALLGSNRAQPGLRIERGVATRRLSSAFEVPGSPLISIRGLKHALTDYQPDIVHGHGIFSLTPHFLARTKRQLGYVLVYDTHASTFNTNLTNTLPKRIYHFFFQKLMMPVIRENADAIIAVGESERWLACQEFGLDPEQVPIIHLGADVDLFKFDEGVRKQVRESLGVGEDDVLLIHAGKLTAHKDVHVLLEAVVPLMREMRHLKLLIVGGGDEGYIESLRQIIREGGVSRSVILHDFVDARELPWFYSAADVGVWPGNLSNTIQEGMAVGLPVILPDVVSEWQTSRHLLTNGNGLGFPRGDSVALSRCVAQLAGDAAIRREMGQRSRELVEREFSWKAIAKQFLDLYEAASDKQYVGEL